MDDFFLEDHLSTGGANEEGTRAITPVVKAEKLAPDYRSAREFCIYVLKANGLLPQAFPSDIHASQDLNLPETKYLPCNICGISSNPTKMMICDLCDEAFHLTCCGEKEPFHEDWFCQSCSKKRPRPLLNSIIGLGEYTSKVRIGNDFQAEVPEWVGPINEIDEYFREPTTLDPTDCSIQDGWRFIRPIHSASYGNWLQCRQVLYFNEDAEVVCGKWRRAPLFVNQTNNWDCSCSVVWDPFHADCAVPQEVETEEVLRQLKFINQLKLQLNKKRKAEPMNCGSSRK